MKSKVTLEVERIDHAHVVLTNGNGDTFTSKSESLSDFLIRSAQQFTTHIDAEVYWNEKSKYQDNVISLNKEDFLNFVKEFATPVQPTQDGDSFYRINFVDCGKDYDYTICRDWSEVMDYMQLSDGDLNTNKSSINISLVTLTEKQYNDFLKTVKP